MYDFMRTSWTTFLILYLSMFAVLAASLFVSLREQHNSECKLVDSVVAAYDANPPKSDLGLQLELNYRDLKRELGC